MSLLYTIVKPELIFENIKKVELQNSVEEISYKGMIVTGHRQKDNTFIIERIITTKPEVYLDASIAPGSVINLYN